MEIEDDAIGLHCGNDCKGRLIQLLIFYCKFERVRLSVVAT